METLSPNLLATLQPTSPRIAELERLGDEIAELSAHLDAATAPRSSRRTRWRCWPKRHCITSSIP
ncbi:MAG TPA: hypothetical protein VGB86_06430, partial [Methylomirabilota bacterium]